MVERRERPRCRKVIESMLAERKCELEDLLKHPLRISDGLKAQIKKMMSERPSKSPKAK